MTTSPRESSGRKKLDDWLSPILVKELREGMRGRAFVLPFLLVQAFLVILVFTNLAAMGDRAQVQQQSAILWAIVGFTLLFLMPLRGLTAVSQEIKRQTIETILLTHMTAWRIVFGKWSALFAQSLLLTTAVLPYIVLRYFIGGDDVVNDFEVLLLMLWLSGQLIVISIAVSSVGNGIIRTLLLIGCAWAVGITLSGGASLFDHFDMRSTLIWLVVCGLFFPALLFEITASSIAPVSENHAVRRRGYALAFFCLAALLNYWMPDSSFYSMMNYLPLLVLVGVCYFDLSEKPRLLPRLVEPWARMGPFGRLTCLFFLPGWPSALLFFIVTMPAAVGIHYSMASSDYQSVHFFNLPLLIFGFLGSVLVPILICHLLWPKMNQVALMVVLYNIILLGVGAILKNFATLLHFNIDEILMFFPSLPVILINSDNNTNYSLLAWYDLGNLVSLCVVTGILLLASAGYFRQLFSLFQAAWKKQEAARSATVSSATS